MLGIKLLGTHELMSSIPPDETEEFCGLGTGTGERQQKVMDEKEVCRRIR